MIRPPDINLDTTTVPDGCYLLEGSYLVETMRRAKLPYGVASQRRPLPGGQRYVANAGLVMFESDRAAVDAAMRKRAANKIRKSKGTLTAV